MSVIVSYRLCKNHRGFEQYGRCCRYSVEKSNASPSRKWSLSLEVRSVNCGSAWSENGVAQDDLSQIHRAVRVTLTCWPFSQLRPRDSSRLRGKRIPAD